MRMDPFSFSLENWDGPFFVASFKSEFWGGAFFLIYADWKEEGFLRATKVKLIKYV